MAHACMKPATKANAGAETARSVASDFTRITAPSIENLSKPGLPAALVISGLEIGVSRPGILHGLDRSSGKLDQLVELTAVQPDTPALRTVIDLHALPLGHGQDGVRTRWTLHLGPLVGTKI